MPTRSTRKRSPVDKPRQTHFTPRNRTVPLRKSSSSTSKTWQQTLTQIDFVSRPPDNEDDDLAYEQEELPRAKKRRKTLPETTAEPRKRTRAKQPAKRKYVKKARNDLSKGALMAEDELGQLPQDAESKNREQSMAPPPTTPRKIIKTEIPSSQSPPCTALSTQSRRSLRMCSRSPLKEKSTNSRTLQHLHLREIKSIGAIPKTEVRDTYEDENEEIQLPGFMSCMDSSERQRLMRSGMGQCHWSENTDFKGNYKDDVRPRLSQEHGAGGVPRATNGTANHVGNVIRDSDSEEEVKNDLAKNDFDAGLDTQAALQHAEFLSSESSHDGSLDSDPVDFGQAATITSTFRNALPIGGDRSPDQNIKDKISDQIHHSSSPDAKPKDYCARSSAPSLVMPLQRRINSEQASDQLAADLHRFTQITSRPLIEIDSQFENVFRPYSPPPQLDDDIENTTTTDDLSHHALYASSPPKLPQTSRSQCQPVPPSRATITDITQPSQHPKRRPQVRTHSQRPPPRPSNGLVLGPSAATFVFSSPPLDGGELGSQYMPLWDGKPLTDSQLLPDSLMNISIPLPPGWRLTQESLEEE